MITGKVSHIRGGTYCSLNSGKGETVSAGVGGVSECRLMGESKHDGIREQHNYIQCKSMKISSRVYVCILSLLLRNFYTNTASTEILVR